MTGEWEVVEQPTLSVDDEADATPESSEKRGVEEFLDSEDA